MVKSVSATTVISSDVIFEITVLRIRGLRPLTLAVANIRFGMMMDDIETVLSLLDIRVSTKIRGSNRILQGPVVTKGKTRNMSCRLLGDYTSLRYYIISNAII